MKIVVVEDSLTVRDAILERLAEEPFLTVVGQASSPAQAFATVNLSKPDAVLLDLGLRNGTHGIDVLQELRASGFSGHIFVLSASPYERRPSTARHVAPTASTTRATAWSVSWRICGRSPSACTSSPCASTGPSSSGTPAQGVCFEPRGQLPASRRPWRER